MLQPWLERILPSSFFNYGPQGLMWWQWLAIPVVALLALAIGRPLGALTRNLLGRAFHRTRTTWDDRLLARAGGALTMFWAIAIFRLALPWIALAPESQAFVHRLLAAAFVVTTFWALWRSVDVFFEMLLERSWAADNLSARSLVSVTGNFAKAAIAVIGIISTFGAFGYPVATALAGLGIGGIALAFGAQKTVENLFGSVALATDQPFRVGDTIKVEDLIGTVERVGTRSTRIRTPDRTLVTIPNGRLADMRIETFAARDRIRFASTVTLMHGTTSAQLERIVAGMAAVMRKHPRVWPDAIVARFAGFNASGLDVEVLCWFQTADFDQFRLYREEVLLAFLRVIEDAGTQLSLPAASIYRGPGAGPSADAVTR
jgi:MscS family membrane protein